MSAVFIVAARRVLLSLLLALLPLLPAHAASGRYAKALDAVLNAKGIPAAQWGVYAVESRSGALLYARESRTPFLIASLTKLVTGAAALDALGPDFRFVTHLLLPARSAKWRDSGRIDGDLILIGGGDPSFGSAADAEEREILDRWARRLAREGLREVGGNVIGDDNLFVDEPLGPGWSWDDESFPFAAQASGLTVREGSIAYRVRKSRRNRGRETPITLYPQTGYVTVEKRINDALLHPRVRRLHGSNRIVLELPAGSKRTPPLSGRFAVENPAAYAAWLLREALERAGVRVAGRALDGDAQPGYHRPRRGERWAHYSAPLSELLTQTNKRSLNLYAEHLLRMLGVHAAEGGDGAPQGSLKGGLTAVRQFLRRYKIADRDYLLADGSGLSRYNLFAPHALGRLLRAMRDHPHSKLFRRSLSVAGRDGTLAWRLRDTPLTGRVRAKTGSMRGVRGIAGYLSTPRGRGVDFVIVANHFIVGDRAIRGAIDRFLLRLAELADR